LIGLLFKEIAMKPRWSQTLFTVSLLLAFLLAACGGGGSSAGAVNSLEDVKTATVQIVAKGTFRDPQVGMVVNAAGAGTGFIIDPSGLVVTNNHVVTGAALLEVYIGGETEAHNAKVLGVSECSDLAVIDIDGEGFPYLEWYEGDITAGMDVYAAGYPLGDPEYTLTKGIVAKEQAAGDTPWSSVEHVIEHDATINPGNSGGPLVTADGKIVAVNYLKSAASQFVAAQYFAIDREAAVPVIDRLKAGEDVNSIGINGEAVSDGESLWGVWVASVKSGSPADVAGLKPGDILVTLEGLVLATDYTLSSYCDVLRTHNPTDVMNIEVLRFDTMEYLQGQLNGRPLESQTVSTEREPVEDTTSSQAAPGATPTMASYGCFETVKDDYNSIQVDVPCHWNDVDGRAWKFGDENIGPSIWASTDVEKFNTTWTTPGVKFNVTSHVDKVGGGCSSLLDAYQVQYSGTCTPTDRQASEQRGLDVLTELYLGCGSSSGPGLFFYCGVPQNDPDAFLVFFEVLFVTEEDLTAMLRVFDSAQIIAESLPY
jgi:serine protease Do